MTIARAALAIAALGALADWAPARAGAPAQLYCPSTAAAQRLDALEQQVDSLEERLDTLGDRLEQLADERRDALDQAKDKVEAIVRDEGLSPEQRDQKVAQAISQAEARGQSTATQAQALHRSMADLKSRIETLHEQMRALAGRKPKTDDDAG